MGAVTGGEGGGSGGWRVCCGLLLALAALYIEGASGQYAYPIQHNLKTKYVVGGLAFNGPEILYKEMTETFQTHLNQVVGPRFDPPLEFELVALDFTSTFTTVDDGTIDFIYTNPSLYSCAESEHDLLSLATLRRSQLGQAVSAFGGVIFVRADNNEVQTIRDIFDKTVAAASISGLGSGQAQWLEMEKKGMNLMQDPKQVIFTSNQGLVVKMVYHGEIDVGFVRTDQIERMEDDNAELKKGVPTRRSMFKYIDVKKLTHDGGAPYPFNGSTDLYPEWNLGALPTVDWKVVLEVQRALQALNSTSAAAQAGKYLSWQPSLSYLPLRDMQRTLGLLFDNENGKRACRRSSELYDLISCPEGHFKSSQAEVAKGCADAGLPCPAGLQCVCRPCVRAEKVEIIPFNSTALKGLESTESRLVRNALRCGKMQVCGSFQQREELTVMLKDNVAHSGPTIHTYVLRIDEAERAGVFELVNKTETSMFLRMSESVTQMGTHVLELFVNDTQLDNSPVRLLIRPRDCSLVFGEGSLRVPDETGECLCQSGTFELGGRCTQTFVVVLSVLLPTGACLLVCLGAYFFLSRNRLDALWQLQESDLVYADPPVVIGKGSFGLVLQADCRGTTVAVKRVLPPKGSNVVEDQDMFELDRWVERTAQSSIAMPDIQMAILGVGEPTSPPLPAADANFSGSDSDVLIAHS
eukprot:CAMPEP_0206225022 /NCGR_PEP_ID=MMETSP0047_2-20121206/7333_1 /ASSEMBLY_ACC=CAM_ASM_000192 /TAXON_ID=195065 /ORGANISM="Chroomonas mesostigmatica_cf, Strain CCMP1168" /LENGTH=693 /DNA_ID=CAMNT_0053648009 /DNA_START=65 /DNA_END=2143 /DNA_ORIENTATION=+